MPPLWCSTIILPNRSLDFAQFTHNCYFFIRHPNYTLCNNMKQRQEIEAWATNTCNTLFIVNLGCYFCETNPTVHLPPTVIAKMRKHQRAEDGLRVLLVLLYNSCRKLNLRTESVNQVSNSWNMGIGRGDLYRLGMGRAH